MEGLVDNRPQSEDLTAEQLAEAGAAVTRAEAASPRQVRVLLTPMTKDTLVTVVTQEWQGRLRVETRVLAQRLQGISRLDWAVDPWETLRKAALALAATLDA